MKKNKKKNQLLGLLVVGVCLLSACNPDKVNNENNSKTITIGTSADYEPFEYKDEKNNIIGFDIEMTSKIAKELGYKVEYKDIPFDDLLVKLKSGEIDMVAAALTRTEEREKEVDFSDVYYIANTIVLTKKNSPIKTIDDFQGKKIGVQKGTVQEELLGEIKKGIGQINSVSVQLVPELLNGLKKGEIDAVIIEDSIVLNYLDKEFDGFIIEDENISGFALAFQKDSTLIEPFNKKIKELKINGDLEELIKKWISE